MVLEKYKVSAVSGHTHSWAGRVHKQLEKYSPFLGKMN